MTAPVRAASSRWPLRKSACTWVSITRSIVSPDCGRLVEVDGDISARIDDNRTTGRLVTDEIRGVRQTRQVVLREDHRSRPRDRTTYSPRGSPPARFGTQREIRLIPANRLLDAGQFWEGSVKWRRSPRARHESGSHASDRRHSGFTSRSRHAVTEPFAVPSRFVGKARPDVHRITAVDDADNRNAAN